MKKVSKLKSNSSSSSQKNKLSKISFFKLLFLILITIFIFFAIFLVLKTSYNFLANLSKSTMTKVSQIKEERNLKQFEKTETVQVESKILTQDDIIKSLASIINLPKEEMSVFAKVKDPLSLEKESAFYLGVKRGDYIVIYPSLAVIYDPDKEKIIRTMSIK
jgi:cytoskeletal protein RodZ